MPGGCAAEEDIHQGACRAVLGVRAAQPLQRLLQPPVRHLRGSRTHSSVVLPAALHGSLHHKLPAVCHVSLGGHLVGQLVQAQGLVQALLRHLLHCHCDAVVAHPAHAAVALDSSKSCCPTLFWGAKV